MDAASVLEKVRAAGGDFELHEGGLRYVGPAPALTEDLRRAVAQVRAALVELVAGPDVAWRARAMRSMLRPGLPLPFLIARPSHGAARGGSCLSCGDGVAVQSVTRCPPCELGAHIAVAEFRRASNEQSGT